MTFGAVNLTPYRQALVIVQPDTLLRWHRHLFRTVWSRRSQSGTRTRQPCVSPETIALIQEMARANRTWGAERMRGERRKLNIRVAKWTIQKDRRQARPSRPSGQTWATFLHNHAAAIGAADLLPVTDVLFRLLYAFFSVELASRRGPAHRQVTFLGRNTSPPNDLASRENHGFYV